MQRALGDRSDDAIVQRLSALRSHRQDAEAVAGARRAARAHPDSAVILNELAWYLVVIEPSPAQLEEAVTWAERAVACATDAGRHTNALDTLGWALFQLGRTKDALPTTRSEPARWL